MDRAGKAMESFGKGLGTLATGAGIAGTVYNDMTGDKEYSYKLNKLLI